MVGWKEGGNVRDGEGEGTGIVMQNKIVLNWKKKECKKKRFSDWNLWQEVMTFI